MQQAIENGDFLLQYQPRVHLATGAIVGAEALIRWQHPVFGLQPPDRFLPAAEQTGLILDIGEWGLRRAARFAAALNRARSLPLPLSVNLSRVHFRRRDLPRTLQRIVIESGIDPSWLTLDLTESIFADPTAEMLDTLHRLRDLGFGISIDDFGTGASSIRHLGTFPLTEIKVDRSFVAGIDGNEYNRAVMESVLRIGAALDVAVTAEGIEARPERMKLVELGCPFGQGYLFSPPLDEDVFAELAEVSPLLPVQSPRDLTGHSLPLGRDAA
jgi:EAL domain-containing protein (putative c-di-GMP-specific phosphodiesterase class I)